LAGPMDEEGEGASGRVVATHTGVWDEGRKRWKHGQR
jgi:hypothetical protein